MRIQLAIATIALLSTLSFAEESPVIEATASASPEEAVAAPPQTENPANPEKAEVAKEETLQDGLFFPLNKTDSQILPQRFEYHLINKDQIRIGNVIMDANQINFTLGSRGSSNYVAKFQWPAGLITQGEIVIKDNTGKALWKRLINSRLIQVQENSPVLQGEKYNGNLATFVSDSIDADVLRKMKIYPFFRFCVHSEELLTKIYLCSKEMYFKKTGSQSTVTARDSFRKESYVEVNGQAVGDLGMIYLQSPRDPISMRTKLLSGATLEVDTRQKYIDFKDIYLTNDKKIIVKASGTEPVSEDLILARTEDGWTTELKRVRPFVYVKGEGGIPMKQEFIIGKNIRTEDLKVAYASTPNPRTYADSETIHLKTDRGTTLDAEDRKTKLEKVSETEWNWHIEGLHKNNKSRSYLAVQTDKGKFIAAHDIFRARRHELIGTVLMTPIWLNLKYQYWMTPKLGLQLRYENFIQKGSSEPSLAVYGADLHYRLTPGIHLVDPSHGLSLSYQMMSVASDSVSAFAVGGFLNYKAPKSFESFSDFFIVNLRVPVSGSGGTYTVQSGYSLETLVKKIEPSWNWETGLRLENYQLNTTLTSASISRASLLFGMGTQF